MSTERDLRIRNHINILLLPVVLVLLTLYLFPFFWMISTALKLPAQMTASPPILWPTEPQWGNVIEAIERIPFWIYLFNSAYVAIFTTAILLFTGATAGYAFWLYRFPGNRTLFALIIGLMIIPPQMTVVPLYLITVNLGMLNTYPGLLIQGLTNVFGVFLIRQFLQTIPKDLIEAGRIEGVREWGIFFRIVTPLMKPALAALAIFVFTTSWNTFLWPLIVATSRRMYTLQVGVAFFSGQYSTDHNLMMVIVFFSILPVSAVYLALQKHFVEGISLTGIK